MYSPIPIKRNMKYGNNYWEVYSPKLQRNVRLFSDLEYDHWVLVETNPSVKTFCEQPLRIRQRLPNGDIAESIFDMWIQWDSGEEGFVEVKYSNELDPHNTKSARALRQTTAQRLWCESNGYHFLVQTEREIRSNSIHLSNMKLIIPYVKNHRVPVEIDRQKVIRSIKKGFGTIGEIEHCLTELPASRVRETIYSMIYNGILFSNSTHERFGPKTEVWLNGSQKMD